jgi:hypothetical protein
VQYTNGLGNFQGTANFTWNNSTNTLAGGSLGNSILFDSAGVMTLGAVNSIDATSLAGGINLTATTAVGITSPNPMSVIIGGSPGISGQVLESSGVTTNWANTVNSLNSQVGAVSLTSSGNTVAITTPVTGQVNLEVSGSGSVTTVNGASGAITISGANGVSALVSGATTTLEAPGIATAQSTADTALADAGTAQGTADSALALATTADATATSALALAGTADATANSALALAGTALAQSGVTSVNSGTGAISINAGTGISVGTVGSVITVTNSSPGGVTSLNSLTGAITLSAGTNIDITPSGSTLTIQAKNYPISERATSIASVNITATTFATAQTILTFTITPTFVSDIDITCSFTYQTNSNTIYDLIYYATIDGAQTGIVLRNSLGGVGHFNCVPLVASALTQTATLHTIAIKAYAGSAPASGNFTVTAVSAIALANLV